PLLRDVLVGGSYSDLFFVFSSRRRHTRSKRDWSSDVCSSDLYSYTSTPSSPNNFFASSTTGSLLDSSVCSDSFLPCTYSFRKISQSASGIGIIVTRSPSTPSITDAAISWCSKNSL